MGLFDRLFAKRQDRSKPIGMNQRVRRLASMAPKMAFRSERHTPLQPLTPDQTPRPDLFQSIKSSSRTPIVEPPPIAQWFGAGQPVNVRDWDIPGGLIYVGHGLTTFTGSSEPALIDPSLPAKANAAGASQNVPRYSPSYRALTAGQRGRYLTWLAGGRSDPAIEIGYVLLFFYGLERRVVVDILMNDVPEPELPTIRATVADLSKRYSRLDYSLTYCAKNLLDLIDALLARQTDLDLPPIPLNSDRHAVPTMLKVALGSRATAGIPILADLALAWAWYEPNYAPRTAAVRCPDEFARLWTLRFDQTFPTGLAVSAKKARVRVTYSAANQGIRHVAVRLEDVPDVMVQKIPASKLIRLFEDVTHELDAYSRWLARNPYSEGTLQAVAMLPPVLIEATNKTVAPVIQWANELLGTRSLAQISGDELVRLWQPTATEKLTKGEAAALARLLGQIGFGIEPDLRFGSGPLLAETPVILFRSPSDSAPPAEIPSPGYIFATLLAHLARAVRLADGEVSSRESDLLGELVESALGLDPAEKARLHAHLVWLSLMPIKLTGLTKRIAELNQELRTTLGNLLILVATADGVTTPNVVTVLTKIFRLLELDPALVMSGLHAALTQSSSPATNPVTVRPGSAPEPGYEISPPSTSSPRSRRTGRAGQGAKSQPRVAPTLALDETVIAAKVLDTHAVATLLGDIFADVEGGPAPTSVETATPPPTDSPPTIGGLDLPHSLLLRALAKQTEWSRAEFAALAAEYEVLPDGAIDLINEAAIEVFDEPLLEGDDILTVNSETLEHLLA